MIDHLLYIGGRRVHVVETEVYGEVVRFRCDRVGYDVASLTRPVGIGTRERELR